ncbi:TPA: hypothetical protein ACPSKB_002439 [Legionella feeleii]
MVKTKQETLRKTNLIDSPFFKVFAKNYLDYLGNSNPTHKQLAEIQALLSKGIHPKSDSASAIHLSKIEL